MPALAAPDTLALQRLYHWEKTAPDRIAFTQPIGGGAVRDYRWAEVVDQARRMAAQLQLQGIGPGDRVAILSKNTVHWMLSDYAIFMAGAVSVPLYPTLAPGTIRQILEHSGSKLLFVGKLDGWEHMKPGIPADLPCIAHPLAPADAQAELSAMGRRDRTHCAAGRRSRCARPTSCARSSTPRAPPACPRA